MPHLLIIVSDPARPEIAGLAGHTCVVAPENEAMDAFWRERPDLVVLAGANPRPFARAIQALDPGVPMVAVCTEPELEEQRTLKRCGVETIVFRPYAVQTLERAIAAKLPAGLPINASLAR